MSSLPSNSETLVTVFGGSGFLGRHVVRALAKRDYRLRIGVRRPDLAGHLQPLGKVGQIHAVQANVRYPASVEAAVRGASIVINLVGILAEGGAQTFDAVQAKGAATVAQAAAAVGARVIHVSALGADADSASRYARAKAAGEAAVREAAPEAIIFRPSVVFGPEDDFTNRFASMARMMPVLPLIGGGTTQMQPVYAGDVATAIADAANGLAKKGATYELGGPEIMTSREIFAAILEITDRKRDIIINKKMPSAFHETPLQSLAVHHRCDTVIVTGGSTSGCVRATVVDSLSRGYRTIVPEECVADLHESPHFANLYDMLKKYADVRSVAEVIAYYEGLPS